MPLMFSLVESMMIGLPEVPKVPTAVLKVTTSELLFVPVIAAVEPETVPPTQLEVPVQFAVVPVLSQVPSAACAKGAATKSELSWTQIIARLARTAIVVCWGRRGIFMRGTGDLQRVWERHH